MKSVIHESSTLGKAIEQGWIKAGSPVEFSIKILQSPKKGFLGLNSTPAKIVIFFDEKKTTEQVAHPQENRNNPHQKQQRSLNTPNTNLNANASKDGVSKQQEPRKHYKTRPLDNNKKTENRGEFKSNRDNKLDNRLTNKFENKSPENSRPHHEDSKPQPQDRGPKKQQHHPEPKENDRYKQDEQRKRHTPAHGDRTNKRWSD